VAAIAAEIARIRALAPDALGRRWRAVFGVAAADDITAIDDGVRGIVERNWPHLISKLPPRDE
jgi:hypothetical protein